jgi:hypothetical protein
MRPILPKISTDVAELCIRSSFTTSERLLFAKTRVRARPRSCRTALHHHPEPLQGRHSNQCNWGFVSPAPARASGLRDKRDYHEFLTGTLQDSRRPGSKASGSSPVHSPLSFEMSFLCLAQRSAKDLNLVESRKERGRWKSSSENLRSRGSRSGTVMRTVWTKVSGSFLGVGQCLRMLFFHLPV